MLAREHSYFLLDSVSIHACFYIQLPYHACHCNVWDQDYPLTHTSLCLVTSQVYFGNRPSIHYCSTYAMIFTQRKHGSQGRRQP